MRPVVIWSALTLATLTPIGVAATSPFLTGRAPIYLIGGFAGIAALSVLLIQPLLAARLLPLTPPQARKAHRILGTALIALTLTHVIGLYLTSPPDALDALLLRSPTPFSIYGVTALWSVIATTILVTQRKRLTPRLWQRIHTTLALIIILSTIAHALMIQGAMGTVSKWILCALAIVATVTALLKIRKATP